MTTRRRRFTAEFRRKAALEALRGADRVQAIARRTVLDGRPGPVHGQRAYSSLKVQTMPHGCFAFPKPVNGANQQRKHRCSVKGQQP